MIRFKNIVCFVAALTCVLIATNPAPAVQFSFLDPAYTQEIYAGPNVGLPGAWTSANQLLARKGGTSPPPDILEYSSTQTINAYQGTNLHQVAVTHTIANLQPGNNLAMATNGFLYLPTTVGLQRVDPNNWAAPAVTVTTFGGPGYGVNALPNGNVVYNANSFSTDIHIYNPVTFS